MFQSLQHRVRVGIRVGMHTGMPAGFAVTSHPSAHPSASVAVPMLIWRNYDRNHACIFLHMLFVTRKRRKTMTLLISPGFFRVLDAMHRLFFFVYQPRGCVVTVTRVPRAKLVYTLLCLHQRSSARLDLHESLLHEILLVYAPSSY